MVTSKAKLKDPRDLHKGQGHLQPPLGSISTTELHLRTAKMAPSSSVVVSKISGNK